MMGKLLSRMGIIMSSPDEEYLDCVRDLLEHQEVRSMQCFVQHGDISCLQHSINVSYKSYRVCKWLGFDYRSAARGGILHDFFLYDWHISKKPYRGLHGLIHPQIALQNANRYFELNKCEQDIICKHMWPLTITLPKYKESCVIIIVDKVCALAEFFSIVSVRRAIEYDNNR